MTKQRIEFKDVALYVNPHQIELSSHSGSHYGVWTIGFVDVSKGIDSIRFWDRYSYTGKRFMRLKFRGQWERDHKDKGVYGSRLQFHDVDVETTEDATALVDMMKRIDKARQNFLIQPKTFGEYIALMCNHLGIKTFVYPTERRDNNRWSSVDQYYHQSARVDDWLVRMIDNKVDATYFEDARQQVSA